MLHLQAVLRSRLHLYIPDKINHIPVGTLKFKSIGTGTRFFQKYHNMFQCTKVVIIVLYQ